MDGDRNSGVSLSSMSELRDATLADIERQRDSLTRLEARLAAIDSVIRGLSALDVISLSAPYDQHVNDAAWLPQGAEGSADRSLADVDEAAEERESTSHSRHAVKAWALRLLDREAGTAYTVDELRVKLEEEAGDAPSTQTVRRAMHELVGEGQVATEKRDGRSNEFFIQTQTGGAE